jgi:hypothetical protein
LKDKITEIELSSKNKNIRVLYRGTTEFKKGYQPKTKLVKDEGQFSYGSSKYFDLVEELLLSPIECTWAR